MVNIPSTAPGHSHCLTPPRSAAPGGPGHPSPAPPTPAAPRPGRSRRGGCRAGSPPPVLPKSERNRTSLSSGISPRNGTPMRAASSLRAAMAEDLVALAALGADEIAHVLHDADHRHIHLAEHVEPFAGIDQGQVLRGGHDHRARQRRLLGQRQLHVARARAACRSPSRPPRSIRSRAAAGSAPTSPWGRARSSRCPPARGSRWT